MAPDRDSTFFQTYANTNTTTTTTTTTTQKPQPKLSMGSLQRTISDISFELINQETLNTDNNKATTNTNPLPPISEVEDAKCECCGMSEECTPQYVKKVREKYCGRMVCGLCSEAVKNEMEKNGGKKEEAVNAHVSTCAKFNRLGRAYPVLCQAEAMRDILRKNRNKSLSPRDKGGTGPKKGGIARSSSCIPAITKDINMQKMV